MLNDIPAPESEQPDEPARPDPPAPYKRGRPPGLKNKARHLIIEGLDVEDNLDDNEDDIDLDDLSNEEADEAFTIKKEEEAYELAVKLRSKGAITTPGALFEALDSIEIDDLIA